MDQPSLAVYESAMKPIVNRAAAKQASSSSGVGEGGGFVVLHAEFIAGTATASTAVAENENQQSAVVKVRPWCDWDSVEGWIAKVRPLRLTWTLSMNRLCACHHDAMSLIMLLCMISTTLSLHLPGS